MIASPRSYSAYSAGPLQSPRFLPTEADYFQEAHRILDDAHSGDTVSLQMYEFQNAATNSVAGATKAPGYADQQALLPGLVQAARRGVKVRVLLDGSTDKKTGDLANAPILDYLQNNGNDHLEVQTYPSNVVNIDHAKELVWSVPGADGSLQVNEALTGGSNWGNHTPANDDGGGTFYGRDALGAQQIFDRDWAFAKGDSRSPAAPRQDQQAPVQWYTTSPVAEGGGSHGIEDVKLEQTSNAAQTYVNQFCLTHPQLLQALADKGGAAHVRLDPNEKAVNQKGLEQIRQAGGEAMWANTRLDPVHFPRQINHEKLDVYVDANGQATGLTFGSANDTANGLDSESGRKTNHEIDAFVQRRTTQERTADGGYYSTAPFLDAALAKTQKDLASRSLQDPPGRLAWEEKGNF